MNQGPCSLGRGLQSLVSGNVCVVAYAGPWHAKHPPWHPFVYSAPNASHLKSHRAASLLAAPAEPPPSAPALQMRTNPAAGSPPRWGNHMPLAEAGYPRARRGPSTASLVRCPLAISCVFFLYHFLSRCISATYIPSYTPTGTDRTTCWHLIVNC